MAINALSTSVNPEMTAFRYLQELILRALLQIEIAEKLAAMKDRLGQAGSDRIDRRFRPQQ
jgi:hypothetical protein